MRHRRGRLLVGRPRRLGDRGPRHPRLRLPVGFAEEVKRQTGIATMAVGLVVDPYQAEAIVAEDRADFVAIGREALADPNWPLHAEAALGAVEAERPFESWPQQSGWW